MMIVALTSRVRASQETGPATASLDRYDVAHRGPV
jgi:hypothetical protein